MIGLVGYNFFGDGNALDPTPTNVNDIKSSELTNGVFRRFILTKDVLDDSQVPTSEWTKEMLLNAGFNGNLSAGNLEDIAGDITGYKIKRRKLGDFDWITIAYEQITSAGQLTFTLTDHLAECLAEYEYAFVPMSGNQEGGYIVQSVISKFDGVFIADDDNIFKLDADVQFDNTTSNQRVGIYEPFGRKYPVVVSNGNVSYKTGQVTGVVLNENYNPGEPLDRRAILAQRKLLVDFLNNRRPKILKDWNGNAWLMMVTNNPSVSYMQGSGMGLGAVTFGWTEVGDSNNAKDLYDNGMIPVAD